MQCTHSDIYGVHSTEVSKVPPKLELLRPLLGWAPSDTIKRTFDVTTQYARGRVSAMLKQHWRSASQLALLSGEMNQ
jgi:hypothetical protein